MRKVIVLKVQKYWIIVKFNFSLTPSKGKINYFCIKQTVMEISVKINVNTSKQEEEVYKAIVKGIYYGLDVKHIASPQNVKIEKI